MPRERDPIQVPDGRGSGDDRPRLVDEVAEASVLVRAPKRREARRGPLPGGAVEALGRWLREGRPELAKGEDRGALLLGATGRPLYDVAVWRIVRRVAAKAGIEASPHDLRRSLATGLVAEGSSVEAVRELLGHADLGTTARSVRVEREDLRRAVARLERAAP